MRVSDLSPGWRTEFIVHGQGADVVEHADCIVVRTPSQPDFYWGNFLLLRQQPADGDLERWSSRFVAEVGRPDPACDHLAIGVDGPVRAEALPRWIEAGFEVIHEVTLQRRHDRCAPPARRLRIPATIRVLDLLQEIEALVEAQTVDCNGFERNSYVAHRRLRLQRMALLAEQGQAVWFGAWVDDGRGAVLAAHCGLIRTTAEPRAIGRFQHVETHPDWQRRGLCTALVDAVTAFGFGQWQLETIVLCADPDDVAVGIYEGRGYRRVGRTGALQRRATRDRLAAT